MSDHFNIVVVGAGPGGYIAALKAAQLGARTAVIEKHHLGGTCLNYGCIPSKALLSSAELLHSIREAGTWGINVNGEVTFDWTKIQSRKDKVLAGLRGGIGSLFKGRKVSLFQGTAKLDGVGKIVVTGDKGAQTITADKVILATGSVPARIPGWPTDPEIVCTSDEAVHWKTLPKNLLVVGGGVIGCEFACMMQAFGVNVTIVEMLPGLLPGIDKDLGTTLQTALSKRGITIYTDVKVNDVSLNAGIVKAVLSNGKTVEADRVLVATGRRPNAASLGLESVGIQVNQRGWIPVDDTLQTNVPGYYCIGDANGKCLLAHAASAHGVVAVENALGATHSFHSPIPSAVYTFPEIGAIGMTEQAAREKGLPIAVGKFSLNALGKAMATGHTTGFVKVIRNKDDGAILGVHMVGHNATECIAAAGAMLHQKATVQELAEVVFAHPTISESIKEAAEDALKMGLHLPPKKILQVAV